MATAPGPWTKYAQQAQDGPWTKYATQQAPPGVPAAPTLEMNKLGALDAGGGWSPDDILRGAASGIKNMLHPILSAAAMGESVTASGAAPSGMYPTTAATTRPQDSAANLAVQTQAQNNQAQAAKSISANPAYTAGSVAGPALVTAGIAKGTGVLAPKIGGLLQDLGTGSLNSRMNVGTKDMLYGQNPARGILTNTPGIYTKAGLGERVSGAMDANGKLLSNAVYRADANANAPTLTPSDLAPSIDGPINSKLSVVKGIGNHTADAETGLTVMRQKAATAAPGATAPIYGPDAPSSVLPSDLWKSIQNIDKNTRFNPQPEVETLNEVGRDIRGGLRNKLETVDPTIKPISQNYSDLASAQTALDRQGAPYYQPTGIRSLLASTVNSYPVRTGIASALYKTGSALKQLGPQGVAMGSVGTVFSPKNPFQPPQLEANVPGNAGFGEDFSAGPTPARNSSPLTPPAPRSPLALPAIAAPGETQPMIGVKASNYPPLAQDFSRTRVAPSRTQLNRIGGVTLNPTTSGLALPAPPSPLALPATTTPGTPQPMIGVKAPAPYPSLYEDAARMRVQPNKFAGPPTNPFNLPKGYLMPPKKVGR